MRFLMGLLSLSLRFTRCHMVTNSGKSSCKKSSGANMLISHGETLSKSQLCSKWSVCNYRWQSVNNLCFFMCHWPKSSTTEHTKPFRFDHIQTTKRFPTGLLCWSQICVGLHPADINPFADAKLHWRDAPYWHLDILCHSYITKVGLLKGIRKRERKRY